MDAMEYWQTVGQWELYLTLNPLESAEPELTISHASGDPQKLSGPGGTGYVDTPTFS